LTGYLGLGSNEGDRLANLRRARDLLAGHGVEVTASSSVYQTAPQGEVLDQPDFLNACVRISTSLEPADLLRACKEVERDLGRTPGGPRHSPRPVDVDVLLLGGLEFSSDQLRVPHPDLAVRRFVLEPLLELDPGVALPDGSPLAPRLAMLAEQGVERVGPW